MWMNASTRARKASHSDSAPAMLVADLIMNCFCWLTICLSSASSQDCYTTNVARASTTTGLCILGNFSAPTEHARGAISALLEVATCEVHVPLNGFAWANPWERAQERAQPRLFEQSVLEGTHNSRALAHANPAPRSRSCGSTALAGP